MKIKMRKDSNTRILLIRTKNALEILIQNLKILFADNIFAELLVHVKASKNWGFLVRKQMNF